MERTLSAKSAASLGSRYAAQSSAGTPEPARGWVQTRTSGTDTRRRKHERIRGEYSVADKITGYLKVGYTDAGEVVINHPDLQADENGIGHIVFSPDQARGLSKLLLKHASFAEKTKPKRPRGSQQQKETT